MEEEKEKELIGFTQRNGKLLPKEERKDFPRRRQRECSGYPGDLFLGTIRSYL
jgi:hypothetical protein